MEIEASAFVGNKSVKTLTIKGAPVIGESAFKSCSALTTVNLGNTTVVGASAFESCPLLTSVTATGLETVGTSAFRDCATLTTINVSNDEKVLTLGDTAFDLCPAVKEIYINQPLSYESGSNWFASSAIVEKSELYNFNEREFDSLG